MILLSKVENITESNEVKPHFETSLRLSQLDVDGAIVSFLPISATSREAIQEASSLVNELIDKDEMKIGEQENIAYWAMGKAGCNPPVKSRD